MKKLIVAVCLVLLVLHVGDPYAEKNADLAPYLPPAPDDQTLIALKQSGTRYFEDIGVDELLQNFWQHPWTTASLAATREALESGVSWIRDRLSDDLTVTRLENTPETYLQTARQELTRIRNQQ